MGNNTENDVQGGAPVDTRRRRFFQGAAGTALLSTVAARGAWATGCTLSGNLSGNLSGQHDQTNCTLAMYSPGGWLNGAADNKGLWSYTGYGKSTPASAVLGPMLDSSNVADSATLADCLGGGNHGWERQCVAAALNAALWQYVMDHCTSSPGECDALLYIESGFYFPYAVQDIRTIYQAGKNETQMGLWEAAQERL